MEAHGRRALALLLRLLPAQTDAEDAWQETFFALWRALPRLDGERDAWPFIRRTAVRKALDARRGQRLPGRAPLSIETVDLIGKPEPVPLELAALPLTWRACLTLFFREGLSIREIAAELEVPEGTVKTWLFRGRARLREQLCDRQESP